jgi:hypothetical protein
MTAETIAIAETEGIDPHVLILPKLDEGAGEDSE